MTVKRSVDHSFLCLISQVCAIKMFYLNSKILSINLL